MGSDSNIEWTDHTFNGWIGCTKDSEGCRFCYAERDMDHRWKKAEWGPQGTRKVTSEANWNLLDRWDREATEDEVRRFVFCFSLADVFEGDDTMPEEHREGVHEARYRLLRKIRASQSLDFLMLTKRPQNIVEQIAPTYADDHGNLIIPPNMWLGTSVENQDAANKRIGHLLYAAWLAKRPPVTFLSMEPLLGPVDLEDVHTMAIPGAERINALTGECMDIFGHVQRMIPPIRWVIVGGESGPNARPMHPAWAASIADQCARNGVPLFFKQWGEWAPDPDPSSGPARAARRIVTLTGGTLAVGTGSEDDAPMVRLGKKRAGRELFGQIYNERPEPGYP